MPWCKGFLIPGCKSDGVWKSPLSYLISSANHFNNNTNNITAGTSVNTSKNELYNSPGGGTISTPAELAGGVSTNGPIVDASFSQDTDKGLDSRDDNMTLELVERASRPNAPLGRPVDDSEFFSRPVVVSTISWTAATAVDATVNYWKLWANSAMVAARLKGRFAWRGKLHLRFDAAPSAYHYGVLRISASPQRTNLVNASGTDAYYGRASQRLGVDIDAAVPGPKELVVPWFSRNPYALTGVVDTEFGNQCLFFITPLVGLARADSATSGTCTVVVRAWVDEFESVGPSRISVVAQSATVIKKEAVAPGPVSRYTGPIAALARPLRSLPGLPGMAASAVSAGHDLLSALGFSRPLSEAPVNVVARRGGSASLCDVRDTAASTGFTAARALSAISPVTGDSGDEMALSRIFSHESLMTVAPWPTTASRDQLILSFPIRPELSRKATGTVWDPTSLAFGALPFAYWRGSIRVKIRLVGSAFHAGTLRLSYDPGHAAGAISANIDATWPSGAVENCQLAFSPAATAEVTINYTSNRYWLPISSSFINVDGLVDSNYNDSVGMFSIIVENALFAPLASQSAYVLIYMSAGPDFEVFGVKPDIPRYGSATTAAAAMVGGGEEETLKIVAQSAVKSVEPQITRCTFGGASSEAFALSDETFGERLVSLRALLKRYETLGFVVPSADATGTYTRKEIKAVFPLHPPDLAYTAAPGVGIVYSDYNTLFRWFRRGYLGYRGSARFKVVWDLGPISSKDALIWRPLSCDFRATMAPAWSDSTNLVPQVGLGSAGTLPEGGRNGEFASASLGERMEFEIPDYSPLKYRFAGSCQETLSSAASAQPGAKNDVALWVAINTLNAGTDTFVVSHAVGDDFSFFYWGGAPNCQEVV